MRNLAGRLSRIPAGVWVAVLTLPALVPLAHAGFFEAHDSVHHAQRLAALDRAVRAGVLYPRWFSEFAFGYGHPVLNFYGPLAYYWGLPFTLLGLSPAVALELVFATGLIASALAMFLFARLHLDRGPATVAALAYAYLPYHLVDLYVRGAVAEFLAFVWFPLILWSFHRLIDPPPASYPTPLGVRSARVGVAALSMAALVATHSLSAFLFAPVLGAYALILLLRRRDWRALGRLAVAAALAAALSAFYWLPVVAESRYVGLAYGTSQGYREHLLRLPEFLSVSLVYPYPGRPDIMPRFPLGAVQLLVLAAAVALSLFRRTRTWVLLFFTGLGLVTAFMVTTPSLPIWILLERALAFLQYPWRFLPLTTLAAAFLIAALVQTLTRRASRARLLCATGAVAVTALWALWQIPVWPVDPDLSVVAMWERERATGQAGTTWTGEFVPVWVTEQRWALSLPPAVSQTPSPKPGATRQLAAGQLRLTGVGYTGYELDGLIVGAPSVLVLHQFHYPGWKASWQGESLPSHPSGPLGLASFDLASGDGPLSVRLGLAPAQIGGTVATLIAALALCLFVLPRRGGAAPANRLRLALAFCLLCGSALLAAGMLWPNGRLVPVQGVGANLENRVELMGYTTGREIYRPGDSIDVTLFWRALRAPDQDYKAFVHLTDAALTRQVAQHDGDPGGGYSPTTRWLPGEMVPDEHSIRLPGDLAPGRYRLWAGMYEYEPMRNLEVVTSGATADDGRVLLGEIEVVAP